GRGAVALHPLHALTSAPWFSAGNRGVATHGWIGTNTVRPFKVTPPADAAACADRRWKESKPSLPCELAALASRPTVSLADASGAMLHDGACARLQICGPSAALSKAPSIRSPPVLPRRNRLALRLLPQTQPARRQAWPVPQLRA